MYIEFRLPSGAGGMAAGYTKMSIWKAIQLWASERNQQIAMSATRAYRFRVEFKDPRAYTILALSWQPKNEWHRWTLVDSDINEPVEPIIR